jgi:hypothetical protein
MIKMSLVQVKVECSFCKGVRGDEFNTKTLEEHCFCESCGYSYLKTLKLHTDGTVQTDSNDNPLFETKTRFGFGTYEITYIGGSVHMGSFSKPISGLVVETFFNAVYGNPRVDNTNCRLTRFENGELASLYGQLPESYQLVQARLEKIEQPF